MSHSAWLQEHLDSFWLHATGIDLKESGCSGIIVAHGDKCYQYKARWEDAGIFFPHGVAIYLLSYILPFSLTCRETEDGWVDPCEWVITQYSNRFHSYFER